MHVGFILTKTPAEEGFNTFVKFLNVYIRNNDVSIYLLGNGVYCFREGYSKSEMLMDTLMASNNSFKIYACLDDLNARGITVKNLIKDVETIKTYDEMVVDMMENVDQILSF
jgi:tRNA 2-thiouridine synthesizing protein B